ncbi:hypothetical protein EXU48_23860 [Occultella glacieicola]|uniref:Uncharacterized protein n=1 Tax=Occultella glacieicola TaxID=2518684 RepID=A0ABY2DWJ2_9MICO|nr:hypothetical protein [Occultella glacieicola]TDE88160.1 hypothetical protein EXU48_23860 [Occultella glacieicola]
MVRKRHGGGQPHKGDRRLLAARVPRSQADEVERRADALGLSISEYIASVLVQHVATTDSPANAQGELLTIREEMRLNQSA